MRTRHAPTEAMEPWWPLDAPATTSAAWTADHVDAGWWDPGDLPRTRLRLASALVDELLATLPAGTVVPGACVVELGCGVGAAAQELVARTGVLPVLHEPDVTRHGTVRQLVREAWEDPATGFPLALADGTVDVVWVPTLAARGTADWAAVVAEAHRLLRPGGHLVAVHCGPGVWAWERPGEAWDEETTGLLTLDLHRPAALGGPTTYVSRWWLQEHWGRGFSLCSHRPAGVLMTHPGQGHGMSSWTRNAGPVLDPDAFAAVDPEHEREGPAWKRQLELAHAEQRDVFGRRATALTGARERLAALEDAGAVDDLPAVRAACAEVAALAAEVEDLRASGWWRAGAPLRALHTTMSREGRDR